MENRVRLPALTDTHDHGEGNVSNGGMVYVISKPSQVDCSALVDRGTVYSSPES